ncbi:MAG: PAS domain S-box protein [Bacteroidetes bacterium]|nr:MAG: PAS domain S-box protein [Bacteroidota bacterium]
MLNGNTIRIAIVEDDEDDFLIIKDYISEIEGSNFVVDWHNDYDAAIEAIKKKQYNIYFVDYFLWEKTGLDLLDEVEALKYTDPIILLTGLGNKSIDIKAMEKGATDYLIKSDLNTEKLERCIRYALERANFLKELKTRENKYRNLFEHSKDAVFIADDKLNFIEVNDAAIQLLGCSEKNLNGRNLFEFISENRDTTREILKAASVEDAEIKIVNEKKEIRDCLLSLDYQEQSEGERLVHGIIHDITKIRVAEIANLQAEKMAANERLTRMLAHEIRNPLNNIILSIDQLLAEDKDDSQIGFMDIIHRNSLRINHIISELLNMAKSSELLFEMHSLEDILEESLSVTSDRINLKKINVKKDFPSTPVFIKADKAKLAIAFTNIIINAIEAMDTNGSLTTSVTASGNNYEVSIKDNGPGIPQDYVSKLFDPFFTLKKNGMGLGLTASYSIIQSHNAKISMQSQVNKGTEFTISFEKQNEHAYQLSPQKAS